MYEEPEKMLIGLESPLLLHVKVTAQNNSYAFSEWSPMAKDRGRITLNPSHVVSQAEADDEIKERYIRMCLRIREDEEDLEEETEQLRDDQLKLYRSMMPKKVSIH